jgi:hypothetical protein
MQPNNGELSEPAELGSNRTAPRALPLAINWKSRPPVLRELRYHPRVPAQFHRGLQDLQIRH